MISCSTYFSIQTYPSLKMISIIYHKYISAFGDDVHFNSMHSGIHHKLKVISCSLSLHRKPQCVSLVFLSKSPLRKSYI